MLNERLCIAEPFLLMIRKYENKLKKEPLGMRLVGIKNSWKYEKDLIILNVISVFFTITRMGNLYLLSFYTSIFFKSTIFFLSMKPEISKINNKCTLATLL